MQFNVAAKYDVVIVGSGISGLICALELAKRGKSVCVLAKEAITEGSSLYAQGGIAVPLGEGDSVEKHLEDTIKAGAGLTDIDVAREIISNSSLSLDCLISYGVRFDITEQNKIHLTKEAAHSVSRVCHVGGDASGKYITKVLVDRVCRDSNISISQGSQVVSLITNEYGDVVGVLVEDVTRNHYVLLASDVILATGGIGQIFENTTNPKVSTGDGVAMAYSIGAELQDIEMIQFHPTVLLDFGDPFLISEAVRGEGGKLRNIRGQYFAKNYHPEGELAPRDILSRAILFELERTNSTRVFLDVSGLDRRYFKSRFPSIYQTCIDRKVDVFEAGIPVAPAAHYFVGGIKSKLDGSTKIRHLWSVGECSSNGFHGANRLASNSLLECIVAPHFLVNQLLKTPDKHLTNLTNIDIELDPGEYDEPQILKMKSELKSKNSKSLGLIRTKSTLLEHLNCLNTLKENIDVEKLSLNTQIQELKNMILLSSLICQAAINRENSIGVHYREDYPGSPEDLKHSIICKNGGLYCIPHTSITVIGANLT